ncbi:MAG: DNA polymerase III subunit beta [Parcubacteria group bacterium Gr01-1014_18]|nr:MAG: DNA polymerase III subunit beta [Parcubacteria group bacterium Greene0416_36]TSC81158.1 MAG: DNA polymerase III subunit beta [Parcubacteria group bacterium Gr01-1014_18]TSC99155.1 MAG: DNA polymerase III subunit beta [Parcubacteria group bacterium Greene1014_20]TSD07487.1 MAG: DNA polymerase III subunit beta [Parcubacteria group bacterium Greene0714_2]
MKFICTQENLAKALGIVSHIASKHTTLPILNNVQLKTENGILKLSSTNLEIGMHSLVRGRIEMEGAFTVNAKLLSDYVHLLPSDQVFLEVIDNVLHIQCKNQKTKINGQSAEDFPLIPQLEKKSVVSVAALGFKKALMQVLFASANDDTRPEISGVYFDFASNRLTLAATDGFRLAEKIIHLEKNVESERNLIVPFKTITELVRAVGDNLESDTLDIVMGDSQILFSFSGTEIVSRLIEGQFPDYRQIIPQSFRTRSTVSVSELANITKSASLFCRLGMNDVELTFEKETNKITVASTHSQIGENVSSIDTPVEGEPNKIIFNYRYLLDGLSVMDSGSVQILIIDSQNAGIFRPENSLDYSYLIMPIKE